MAGKPAARLGDPTAHGGAISGPGIPTVMIGKMPAATMGDMHVCPMVTPGTPPIPHVGGPITLGSTGVFIGKKPAARMGDMCVCVGPPSSILMGCPTVLIGEAGSGSSAGAAAKADAAQAKGIGAPTALQAMAATPPPKAADGKLHYIELEFKDSAGKVLSQVPFQVKDWNGQVTIAVSNDQGRWKSHPYAESGSYELTLLQIQKVNGNSSKITMDKPLQLSAVSEGFVDGTPAHFFLDLVDADHHYIAFDQVSTKVHGNRIQADWALEKGRFRKMVQQRSGAAPFTHVRILAAVGFQVCVSDLIALDWGLDKEEVHFVEIADIHFNHDSAVPCIDENGWLVGSLATALRYAEDHPAEEMVVFGHADTSGKYSYNYDISEWRGYAVKSLLERDGEEWSKWVGKKNKVEDYQRCLKSLANAYGWPCDPGKVDNQGGPNTTKAVRAFQHHCNETYAMNLDEDGVFGPLCWIAMHRVICGLVAQYLGIDDAPSAELPIWWRNGESRDLLRLLRELPTSSTHSDFQTLYPTWVAPRYGFAEGEGVIGCGESFPIEENNNSDYKSEKNRRIELAFLPAGKFHLKMVSNRNKKQDFIECAVYDEKCTTRISIPMFYRNKCSFSV